LILNFGVPVKELALESAKDSNLINETIESAKYRIHKIKLSLEDQEELLTIDAIKTKYWNIEKNGRTILLLFEKHNDECKQKVGVLITQATYGRYLTCYSHVKEFIKTEYKADDLPVTEINRRFYERFELFLKKKKMCAHNTTIKYIRNFNKITRIAVEHGWIQKSPYRDIGYRLEDVDKPYLTKNELRIIEEKDIKMKRIALTRDMFLIGCYTGLSFSDIKDLESENIQTGVDGKLWIIKSRKKTGIVSKIPLLSVPHRIIRKYKNMQGINGSASLLPILSNQKMNAYLKEIADICEINKVLTTHTARRTFATTVMLHNGVSMEAVSKMLGHTSLFMTRKYAKTDEYYISKETERIRELF